MSGFCYVDMFFVVLFFGGCCFKFLGSSHLLESQRSVHSSVLRSVCSFVFSSVRRSERFRALPGAKPQFSFAPAQIAKREKDWGQGMVMARAGEASVNIARHALEEMTVEWTRDVDSLQSLWLNLLDNKISPRNGQMATLLD